MARPDPLAAEVLVTAEVPPEQERAIVEAFGALGVAARAQIVLTRRGVGELQWLLLAVLPLLSTLGSTLADRASKGLKRLVGRVLGAGRETASPPPGLVLQDAVTRLQVVLEGDLPADADDALLSLDLSEFQRGPLHYDRHRGACARSWTKGSSTKAEGSRTGNELQASSLIRRDTSRERHGSQDTGDSSRTPPPAAGR